jgi:very-short-patch-repair endonuclease
MTKPENAISLYLNKYDIKYIFQWDKHTCESPIGNPLIFDFYLPDYNMIIEYDGQHHFFSIKKSDIKKKIYYDQIKDKWAKDNNITLLRINYMMAENIPEIVHCIVKLKKTKE